MPSRRSAFVVAISIAALTVGLLTVTALPASAVTHNPRGRLDALGLSGTTAHFGGWTADPDLDGTVRVVVTVDGTPTSSILANRVRTDVRRAYPSYGVNRGFDGTVGLSAGKHTVCVIAGDLGIGSDTKLGCKTLNVPKETGASTASAPSKRKPIGAFDAYATQAGKLSVRGWALDPDTPLPILVDIMIGGQSLGSALASTPRKDIAKRYKLSGARHGFSYSVTTPVAPGNYELCPVAVNNAVGGNTILPCKIITIRPKTEPESLGSATAAVAADAIEAQAVASGAVSSSAFPAGATSAARIATATRALLYQATGRSSKPAATKGVPAFRVATPSKVVDEQAVMGLKPSLGSFPAAKSGGRKGTARSLQLFANDALATPGASGDGIVGAAAVLLANGVTVHPKLPGYSANHPRLRAEVAIDAALAHLGDPYVWAAAGPGTFDCSGLTQWAWAKAGVSLTHYTGSQALQGVRVRPAQLLPGDLVLFGTNLHHVGMYLGAGYMLDAPDTGAYVRVDKISWFGDFTLAVRP
jgi:cell wall-associated NlpC family hydrolase